MEIGSQKHLGHCFVVVFPLNNKLGGMQQWNMR